jgi:two-component system OmpR family sensor kinase
MMSLRARLLAWLLGGVVIVGVATAIVQYRNALAQADLFFDEQLRQTALLLRDQPFQYLRAPQLPAENPAYDFVVQVWTLDGVRVYLSRAHSVVPGFTTLGFSTVSTSEGRWRVYGVQALRSVIQVAQPLEVRRRQATAMAMRAMRAYALLLPLLGVLIFWVVGGTLAPLQKLARAVRARRPNNLEPLNTAGLPDEVTPLVDGLNDLLARERRAVGHERAFLADAAHELRTPLAALQLQTDALVRSEDAAERAAAAESLAAGVKRANRMIEQLLSLARQEPRGAPAQQRVVLSNLVQEGVREMIALADAKHIDLGVTEAQPLAMRGDGEALRTLLRNLIDNAIRYAPEHGRVDLSVTEGERHSMRAALLRVADSGPGIPPSERERVFDRFYRVPGSTSSGSGLGLSIVKAIADAHGAGITLGEGLDGRGLSVTIAFPLLERS